MWISRLGISLVLFSLDDWIGFGSNWVRNLIEWGRTVHMVVEMWISGGHRHQKRFSVQWSMLKVWQKVELSFPQLARAFKSKILNSIIVQFHTCVLPCVFIYSISFGSDGLWIWAWPILLKFTTNLLLHPPASQGIVAIGQQLKAQMRLLIAPLFQGLHLPVVAHSS